jgi:hypothetical protein
MGHRRALLLVAEARPDALRGLVQHWLGEAARQTGNRAGAATILRAALGTHRDRGEWLYVPDSLEALAQILADEGTVALAARLLSAAASARIRQGPPLRPVAQAALAATMDALRAAMGEVAFAAARVAGAALTLEEAVREAVGDQIAL